MSPSLFQRILGADFFHLAPEVKALHVRQGEFEFAGRVTVERGKGLLSRLCGAFARLAPDMQDAPLTVRFIATPDKEVWRRDFNGSPLVSTLRIEDGKLAERMGLISFRFRLYRVGKDLHWVGRKARVMGLIPLPASWLEHVRCTESEVEGRYHFLVDARLPFIGRLVKYEGWLAPV